MADTEYLERLKQTGRNDSCPCGSGKKYKKCHLQSDEEKRSGDFAETAKKAAAEAAKEEQEQEKKGEQAHPPESKGHGKAPHLPKPKPGAVSRQVSTPRKAGTS